MNLQESTRGGILTGHGVGLGWLKSAGRAVLTVPVYAFALMLAPFKLATRGTVCGLCQDAPPQQGQTICKTCEEAQWRRSSGV